MFFFQKKSNFIFHHGHGIERKSLTRQINQFTFVSRHELHFLIINETKRNGNFSKRIRKDHHYRLSCQEFFLLRFSLLFKRLAWRWRKRNFLCAFVSFSSVFFLTRTFVLRFDPLHKSNTFSYSVSSLPLFNTRTQTTHFSLSWRQHWNLKQDFLVYQRIRQVSFRSSIMRVQIQFIYSF